MTIIRKLLIGGVSALAFLLLTGCGTLTGIPSHGGGKRFSVEQKLVAASIRATLMSIDITPLQGQKVALIYDLISDEGGGQLSGGRLNLAAALQLGTVVSPLTTTTSQFQVFDLIDTQTNFNNTVSSSVGSQTATTATVATSNQTSTDNATSTRIVDATTTGNSTTDLGGSTNTSVTNANSTTTTGGTTTTQDSDSTVTTTIGPSTNTATTTSNTASTDSTVANSTGTVNTSSNATETTDGASTLGRTDDETGGATLNRQVISPTPSRSKQREKGTEAAARASLQYRGLGDYTVLAVPKSDASLLMGLVRNYFLLSGIRVTIPQDPTATAIVYVTVDVFGLNRSRFDAYLYNRENVKAETAMEMFAFDRAGKMILSPRNANWEAEYDEKYLLWAGPFRSDQTLQEGDGLLVDFSAIDGTKAAYPANAHQQRDLGTGERDLP